MGSSKFRIGIAVRVLLLVGNIFLIMWLVFSTNYYFTILLTVAVAHIWKSAFINQLRRDNQHLTKSNFRIVTLIRFFANI